MADNLCDYSRCRKPIIMAWTGRDGKYCSNECKEAAERPAEEIQGDEDMTDELENGAEATEAKSKKGGKAAKAAKSGKAGKAEKAEVKGAAKTAKKAAAKPAPVKKGAAKAEKSDKKAAAKDNKKEASNRGKYSPDQKITLLVKENPRREGTKAYDWFELYRKCKTVGGYLEAGGDRGYMVKDAEVRKLIKIQ